MSPSEYGTYSIVITAMTMLGVLMMLGTHSAIGRYFFIYNKRSEEYDYLSSLWIFQTFISLIICVVLLLFGQPLWLWLIPEIPVNPYFWIVIVGAFLAFSSGLYSIWLRVQQRPLQFVYLQITSIVITVVSMLVLLVWFNGGDIGALYASVFTSLIIALVSFIFLGPRIKFQINYKYIKESILFGSWMMVGTLGSFILNRSQLFILQKEGDLANVGILFLGLQISGIITLFSVSFGKAWQPLIFSAETKLKASQTIASSAKYYILIMLFPALILCLFPNEILYLLSGQMNQSYSSVVTIVPYLAIASFITALGILPATALLHEKRASLTVIIMLGSALINLLLNILLVPTWGINGAVFSFFASSAINVYFSHLIAQRIIRINYPVWDIFKILSVATVILFINSVSAKVINYQYPFIISILLMLFYPLGLVLLGIIERDDILKSYLKVKSIISG